MINKTWPGLIQTYDVALAEDINEIAKKHLPDFENDDWYASRKLDGLRVLAEIPVADKIRFSSRRGKDFTSLDVVKKAIGEHAILDDIPFVFDGEGCIIDEDGMEDFNAAQSQLKKKDFTAENPRYCLIDLISMKDFQAKTSTNLFSDRQKWLKRVVRKSDHLRIVKQILIRDQAHLDELFLIAQEKGWEGLIIRKDTTYQGKRSNDLLKLKAFIDAEYEVTKLYFDDHRLIIDGEEVLTHVFATCDIIHKGYVINVGGGWKKEQRILYGEHPEQLLGATITVRYNGETKNKKGTVSLRFPRCKAVHGTEGRTT